MCQLLAMNANTPADITFSFEGFRKRAGITDKHSDGFGIAFFEGKGVRVFRDDKAAAFSPIADLIKNYKIKSPNVIAHIRQATEGEVSIVNTHPFIREIWGETFVFAHNGTVKNISKATHNFYQSVGETDSEEVFCYILNVLKERFKEKPSDQDLFDAIVEITSKLAENGVLNFILSNGNWMVARCATKLHYVIRRYPFCKAKRDDGEIIDFSKYNDKTDKYVIITTVPLTENEPWIQMKNGGYAFFKDGEKLQEIVGDLPEVYHI